MSLTLHTSLGDLKIELFCEIVPKTAKNFLALCASGFYNQSIFHRNIKSFIIQGGDPTGTGKGGSSIYNEPFEDEFVEVLKHDKRGIVSMCNSGPNTNLSQFCILYAPHTHLDNTQTVFGRVIYGEDTLKAMERAPVDDKFSPLSPIVLYFVTIHANPIAEMESN